MRNMRKVRQATFKIAPKWVNSIAVDSNGHAWGYETKAQHLEHDKRRFWSPNLDSESVFLGSGFDTTDWQNSALNRWDISAREYQLKQLRDEA